MKRILHISWVCCLVFQLSPAGQASRQRPVDNIGAFIGEMERRMPRTAGTGYVAPTEADLRAWTRVFSLFRQHQLDSCRTLLAQYNYALLQVRDNLTGSVYDVIKEDYPVRRGWGTYFYNRNHSKRLYVHVSHPADDPGVLRIGTEMFRRSGAEWLLVAGTGRRSGADRTGADIARTRVSVFQRWHELLTDLTHVTLSLHAYERSRYGRPVSATDVILSNGKTADEQWGISELSLAVRDTLRKAGFQCSVAMYDSGYASLAAGGNPQAIFSNDSVGFGHWMNVELSNAVRGDPVRTRAFLAAAERGLELTGTRVSRQINRAFGLVSPRVVRVDSMHGMMFPPAGSDTYRIIALAPGAAQNDTIDVRMGNWFGLSGTGRMVSSITRIDTGHESYLNRLRREEVRATIATLGELPHKSAGHPLRSDTLACDEADPQTNEPLQVHRIPLQPLMASAVAEPIAEAASGFEWRGMVAPGFASRLQVFRVAAAQVSEPAEPLPNFLIPLVNNSYRSGRNGFIGIQMTGMLVKEITRLVSEHSASGATVGLLAEQSESGDYYLRIFPESSSLASAAPNP